MAMVLTDSAMAQDTIVNGKSYPLPITFTAQQDHDNMMRQLGITALRPGPSGDPNAPNHANYDEEKANPCPRLPDLLTLKNGKKVTTPEMWWKQRRPELVDGLELEVYGRIPVKVPKVIWTVKVTNHEYVGAIPVIAKELVGHVDNSNYPLIDVDIKMVVVVPTNVKGPVPVLMMFGRTRPPAPNPAAPRPAEVPPTEELLRAGWGYAMIDPNSIQADNGAGLTRGIIGLVNKGQARKPEDWGALRAWAWGAARGLDYLETDSLVDAKKAGIEGVSRYGKAALVTLAFEPRFAVGLIGSSGKGGATLLRRNYGEAVESLTGGEYYWMVGNFIKYGASEATFGAKTGCDLDVDSHELIALCAPRLTFISYGIPEKGDAHWLDHEGSYMATIAAGAVFKLLGAKDLGVSNDYMNEKMPPVNSGLLEGELAWRQHDGGHTDAPNFNYFIPWASGFLMGNRAQTGHELWLGEEKAAQVTVICAGKSPTLDIAREELQGGWRGEGGASVRLVIRKDKALKKDGFRLDESTIEANTDIGILYGVYDLLRRQRTGESLRAGVCNPSYDVRILDHWDNLNGTVERGYAGGSIFWRKNDPFTVTEADKKLWREYARANASIGINSSVVDNVNASPLVLTADYLARVKAIADVLRPYGVKAYLAVNFASPMLTGGLKTADPLDPAVVAWWKNKIKEIYGLIPDFGGFLVKASSEGQPGPQQYGRSHADGANMLADELKPFGGIVMWRAFVYAANDNDRAKQAYSEFVPLDGKFRDNVIIQVKNGPVDFQPREPFSPLFGALRKTAVMPEFQVTQEYLGHSVYLVFLSTMWEECLKSETWQQGAGSTVARCTDGSIYHQKYTAIAGVANIGLDTNWCGYLFAQANWYAFGRLAWDDTLTSSRIADEWLKLTFYSDVSRKPGGQEDWTSNFLVPVRQMMLDSREAAVNFMMPLGLHHIMSSNGHYGPGPWWAPKNVRTDWTPPYYHHADPNGIGFDRTTKGSDAVSQYHEPLASEFNDPATCPGSYLLWFHHLPWDYKMNNGQTLWDALCHRWDTGVRQVREFQKTWDKVQPFVDSGRFTEVQVKLRKQCANAILWKDACMLYFQQFSRMPVPNDIDRPVYELDDIIAHEFDHRIQ